MIDNNPRILVATQYMVVVILILGTSLDLLANVAMNSGVTKNTYCQSSLPIIYEIYQISI